MLRLSIFALVVSISLAALPARAAETPPARSDAALLAIDMSWDWDWDEFRKFWSKQLGKTTGIVGTVTLVVVVGMLIVMSAKKKT